MNTTIITTKNGNEYTFYRIGHDINGNPRYCIHFLDMVSKGERDALTIARQYDLALARLKGYGRKYHCRAFGGGIAFTTYSLNDCAEYLDSRRAALPLSTSPEYNALLSDIYADILERIETEDGYFSNVAHYINDPEITVTWGTVRHAGTKFIWYGNLLTGYWDVRQLLTRCGYNCEKWSDDTVYKKYCNAADDVLHWINNNFKYSAI